MYPKDYAARTKWKVGDPVMIFKQDIAKWCPGKIIKTNGDEMDDIDDIQVKYAVLYPQQLISPLIEDQEAPQSPSKSERMAKVTFASNMSSRGSSDDSDIPSPT